CRAQVGSEWWRLCQDSPKDGMASHQTFRDLSRTWNSSSPKTWQIELIDQVTWWSRPMRTSEPQKNAVSAPCQDQVTRPPMTAGSAMEARASAPNQRCSFITSGSRHRSGAYF